MSLMGDIWCVGHFWSKSGFVFVFVFIAYEHGN